MHKTPWVPRPIVSQCGSILDGIARWLTKQLKPLSKRMPSYLPSSKSLKKDLENLPLDKNKKYRLFSADARAMYTNMSTPHALKYISWFLRTSPMCKNMKIEAIITALDIIMNKNIFKFGDTYWKQESGTAMGTSPGCDYATIYFGIYKMATIIWDFLVCLAYYKRYIDDIIGIWICHDDPVTDHLNWKAFKACLSNYGKLEWDITPRSNQLTFLDLVITLENHKFSTKLYYKPRNLYLYLPPHSCHPPGVIKGMIFGQIKRIYDLTTHNEDVISSILHYYDALKDRGCSSDTLGPLFLAASTTYRQETTCTVLQATEENRTYLHLRYNPHDPPRSHIQNLFRQHVLLPQGETPLPEMRNRNGYIIGTDKLIVCYHRHWNLRNYLSPRTLYKTVKGKASDILAKNNNAA